MFKFIAKIKRRPKSMSLNDLSEARVSRSTGLARYKNELKLELNLLT